MDFKVIHIDETASTNAWLRSFYSKENRREGGRISLVAWAEYQTAGKGCGSNSWESERGKNLTFSMLIHPTEITAQEQFRITEITSVALCETLERYLGQRVEIKWPNDIYVGDRKICGMLIENRLQGSMIKDCIIGVGLNVNQEQFHSDAPNPVSLKRIHGQETEREQLLGDILVRFDEYLTQDLKARYLSRLYRRKGFHPYADKEGAFMAEIIDVEDDGHLLLRDDNGHDRRYAFKEVQFVI